VRDRYIDGLYAEHSVFGQKQYTIKDYYAFGRIVAQRKTTTGTNPTSSVTYLLADHLGSTVGTVSDAGATEHMQYYPFGSVRAGHVSTDRGFTGQRREGGSRLGAYFYNARFYATGLGHFMSADTVSTDGLDRYAYVRFNPLRYTDASGHVLTDGGGGGCDTACQWQAAYDAFHTGESSGGCDDLCRCASDPVSCSALADAGRTKPWEQPCWPFCIPIPVPKPDFDRMGQQVEDAASRLANGATRLAGDIKHGIGSIFHSDDSEPAPDGPRAEPLPEVAHPGPRIELPSIMGARPPGDGWNWKGKGPEGSEQGQWVNSETGQTVHPHGSGGGHGPHWDYDGPEGEWRLYPDGNQEPK
jgi:RHS repeat-associated protein